MNLSPPANKAIPSTLTLTVHSELNHFVIETRAHPLAERARVSSRKNNIPRKDRANRLVLVVEKLLFAQIQNVERKPESPVRLGWKYEGESVSDSGNGFRIVDRELPVVPSRYRRRVPPDPLAAGFARNYCLAHPDGLGARGEEQKESAFAASASLSPRASSNECQRRQTTKESPHRSA